MTKGEINMTKKNILLFLVLTIILTTIIPTYAYGSENLESQYAAEKAVKTLIHDGYVAVSKVLSAYEGRDLVISTETTIENKTVNNVHITKAAGNKGITLRNVTIKGELLIDGSSQNSIILENTKINRITANNTNKKDGKVKIALVGDTTVESTLLKSDAVLDESLLTGSGFKEISMDIKSSFQIKDGKTLKLSSSNEQAVTVKSDGTVYAERAGRSTILAPKSGKKTALFEVRVTDPSEKTIKILSIGNSFSQDTMFYMQDIAKSAGVNIVTGNLYNSGCSLKKHWEYASDNKKAYTYYKWTSDGMTETENKTMSDAILDEDWDYITLQQSSADSGIYSTFQPYLNNLASYVKRTAVNPKVKLALNMTWSYSYKSISEHFINYHYDQKDMYNAIVKSYIQASDDSGIDMVIPCGTAIQNARTNKLLKAIGMDLTSDGNHLDIGIGRYIAGLTMFKTIIDNENIQRDLYEDVKFIPSTKTSTEELARLAKKAVLKAVEELFKAQDMQ